jgi:hypothetical protein
MMLGLLTCYQTVIHNIHVLSLSGIYIYIDVESLWHATRRQDGRDLLRLERNRATCIWNILERCPGRF